MRLSWHMGFWRWAGLWLTVGSVLRAWQYGTASRWYDETFTAWISTLPFDRMIEATAGDVHPPLYYCLTWLLVHIFNSDSTWLLRLPSVALGILALVLLIPIGRNLNLNDNAILAGLAFMACSTFQIYYSQEMRMYALFQAEAMLAVLGLLRRQWWLLAVGSCAMMWTQNYGLLFSGLLWAMALVVHWRTHYREWGLINITGYSTLVDGIIEIHLIDLNNLHFSLSGLAAVCFYLPWVPNLVYQLRAVGGWWQQPTSLGSFLEPLNKFWFNENLQGNLLPLGQITISAVLVYYLIRAIRQRQVIALAVLYGLAPLVIAWSTELFLHATFVARTFIAVSFMFYLLVGWGLSDLAGIKRIAAAGMLVPLFIVSNLYYAGTNPIVKSASVDFFTGDIADKFKPGDIVYHMNVGSLVTFRERYPSRPEWYSYVHPPLGDIGSYSARTEEAIGIVSAPLSDLKWSRAWVIYSAGPTMALAGDMALLNLAGQYHSQHIKTAELWYTKLYKGEVWLLTQP